MRLGHEGNKTAQMVSGRLLCFGKHCGSRLDFIGG